MEPMNRKDFLRKLGLGAGMAIVVPISGAFASHLTDQVLDEEKKQFLSGYQEWLRHFHQFVEKRNENPLDAINNQKLMELSSEAEKRKPLLEKFMKDERFAQYFDEITQEITHAIRQ